MFGVVGAFGLVAHDVLCKTDEKWVGRNTYFQLAWRRTSLVLPRSIGSIFSGDITPLLRFCIRFQASDP